MSDNEENDAVSAQQIRVSFVLAPEFASDETNLEVPSEAIAIPSHLKRKGLSAVINHLLGRRVDDDDDDEKSDQDDESMNDADDEGPIDFDFLVGKNSRRLLRTSLDKEVRQNGLSLEEAITVTYFPSTPAPTSAPEKGPDLPDWISSLKTVSPNNNNNNNNSHFLVSACYDGSLHVMQPNIESTQLPKIASNTKAHQGPIKCLDAVFLNSNSNNTNNDSAALWAATGSMDNTVALHQLVTTTSSKDDTDVQYLLAPRATAMHAASVASVNLWSQPIVQEDDDEPCLHMASGDWDGGVFVWRYHLDSHSNSTGEDSTEDTTGSSKKRKTGNKETAASETSSTPSSIQQLTPIISIQAHSSKVSGISWGNYEKLQAQGSSSSLPDQLITASWDHSIKVWNVERQDCLLSLNSSRVVGCLDTSPHSSGICVTGHPDCTVRLWDVRAAAGSDASGSSILVSDNVFRPSHKAWISQVQWSTTNPYQIYSCSHDGTVKVWDIRSPTQLSTVRILPASPTDKVLGLATLEVPAESGVEALGSGTNRGLLFAGGTNRIVEQYRL